MDQAWDLDRLMKHMRDDHGFEDLKGSPRKTRLRNMGYFHGYKGFRFVRKSDDRLPLSSFAELEGVYQFDAKLKAAFYPRVMEAETALKNIILARAVQGCSDASLSTFCKEGLRDCRTPDGRLNRIQVKKNLAVKATLQALVRDAYKNPHVSHYVDREGDAPLWSVFESMSLGNLSHVASSLRDDIEADVLTDIGIPNAYVDMPRDLMEAIRPLRNSIAHNNVIYDARFSQAVRGGDRRAVANAGMLVDAETNLGYEPAFNSIVDYVMLVSILVVYLTDRKTGTRRFVKECQRALDELKGTVGIDMYMKIVGSGDRQKLEAVRRFVSSYKQ